MNARLFVYLLLAISTILATAPPAATAPQADASAGKAIYERLCVSCHGAGGQGGPMGRMLSVPPRNLTDQAYLDTKSDQHLFDVIERGGAATGLSSDMRAFGAQLTDQEIWDTIAYVRTLAVQTTASGPAPVPTAPGAEAPRTVVRLAELRLSIWPEYDDPRVLIMLRGQLDPDSPTPTFLTLPIPKGAEIIGAGMISEQNELVLHPHQVLPGDAQDRLELNLPASRFFVEFYYDPFSGGTDKQFTYPLSTAYAIERLEVDVQQPLRATNFALDPPPARQGSDARGFTNHWLFYRDIAPGETLNVTVSYTKTVLAPSVAKRQPEPAAVDRPGIVMHPTILSFGLLAGAAMLFGGGVWLWKGYQRRRQATPVHQSPSPPLPTPTCSTGVEETAALGADTPNFCSNCGRKLQATHRFCPGCGKLLRQEDHE